MSEDKNGHSQGDQKRILTLIDGDILCYRIGFGYEKEKGVTEALIKWQVDATCDRINSACNSTDYEVYLSPLDKSNFRYKIDPLYKANRSGSKPSWFNTVREHLLDKHNAIECSGEEADDAIGRAFTRPNNDLSESSENCFDERIIASIDKDFLQIPGKHYNFVKNEFIQIEHLECFSYLGANFFTQLLTGDAVDNIQGIQGFGPAKAAKALFNVRNGASQLRTCIKVYQSTYTGNSISLQRPPRAAIWRKDDLPEWRTKLQKCIDLIYIRQWERDRLLLDDLEKQAAEYEESEAKDSLNQS